MHSNAFAADYAHLVCCSVDVENVFRIEPSSGISPEQKRAYRSIRRKGRICPTTFGELGDEAILNIHCAPYGGRLPDIKSIGLQEITAVFQPKLLDYRHKHVVRVRDAEFDAPTLPAPLRMLAKALGSCIVGAPELQADMVQFLEGRAEEMGANRLLDPDFVTIEAIFALCHADNGPIRVGVSEIATKAAGISADRGVSTDFESKAVGGFIRRHGFRPKRDSKGFAIHLTPNVRRLIPRPGRDNGIVDSEQDAPGCPDCAVVMSVQTGTSNS